MHKYTSICISTQAYAYVHKHVITLPVTPIPTILYIFHLFTPTPTQIDSHTCSALISCCTRAIERNTSADRRHQIVLMERAFAVLDDMYRMHITPDTAVWNALIKAAGCTGMLDRAMQVVRDMHTEKCEGDGVTYVSLVDACARVGRTDLALDMYHLALKAGVTGCIQLYAAAIGACSKASPTDIDTALEIYHDSRRYVLWWEVVVGGCGGGRLWFSCMFFVQMRMYVHVHIQKAHTHIHPPPKPYTHFKSTTTTTTTQTQALCQARCPTVWFTDDSSRQGRSASVGV